MSTTNNTPRLTVDHLWSLIDLAFPVKTHHFRNNGIDGIGDGIFYCPSKMSQKNYRVRCWTVKEIKKLKAIVECFGYSVAISEVSGADCWPRVYYTAE
jgi:hypothetical protein